MRVKSLLLVCLAAVGLALSSSATAVSGANRSSPPSVVGAWFCPLSGSAAPTPTEAIVLFHRGGTLTANDTNDFFGLSSRPELAGTTLNSPNQGIWRRSSRRSLAVNFFGYMYGGDAAGADKGLLTSTFRLRCDTRVDHGSLAGNCDLDLWFGIDTNGDGILESQDPSAAPPNAILDDLVGFECRRLPLVEES